MEEELSPEDLEALEMELMEEEEEMEFLAEDDSAAAYNNSENKEQDQHNTSLAKDLSALDLNSDKNDSPSLLEVP
ncbi:uncharacterized protein LOC112343544 [Selaginella moellendorffii]|uniref:uncharacterized protein LOC112343544 n=1 Tax=Selaginella moellendorffii TaxID=88036 RepID=UPI000D1C5170|nr:uncharacterized protein LOC112343544 [Selaginella moellendorffii]|eukprot:XP_024522955.1 uncharacterized protein LOC112343544 [Selaginella moellendorffii]